MFTFAGGPIFGAGAGLGAYSVSNKFSAGGVSRTGYNYKVKKPKKKYKQV